MKLDDKDKRDLISVATKALTYSGIVVMVLAILMGVYYMGIRDKRNKTGANSSKTPPLVTRPTCS
jgi:hypothetical protein